MTRWWHNDQITTRIELTESEIQQLDTMYDDIQVNIITLRGDWRAAQLKLRLLMEAPELDETAIANQQKEISDIRTRMSEQRFAFLLDVRKLIGHHRFQQLMDIHDEMRRQRHNKRSTVEPDTGRQ